MCATSAFGNRRQALPGIVLLVLVVWSGTAPIVQPETNAQENRVAESLERYGRAEFDAAVAELIGKRSVRSLVREFRNGAGAWIDAAPASERQARTLVGAAMSVELLAATFGQDWADYESARGLVEWSCSRLRRFGPVDAERWIHLSFVSLLQGARDDSLLTGRYIPVGVYLRPINGSHAEHAGLRFPAESRFKLAFVTGSWEAQYIATWPLTPGWLTRETAGRFAISRPNDEAALDATLKMLAALFDDRGVGAEARLRSGVLRFLRADTNAARDDLLSAETAGDPAVRYLVHLMLGTIADQSGQADEALRRFRLAYETVPASTASVALAGRLYRSGLTDEAARVLEQFDASPLPPDPWELYGQRDFRFFGAFRDRMRGALPK
jgi:hypothetical protein